MTINERFAEILKSKNISVKEASILVSKSEVYVRKLMRAGESFGIEPVLLILNSIDDINPDWLLREKGGMFRNKLDTNNSSNITNERLFSMIESQQRTIESQQVTIGSMQEQNKKMIAQTEDAATCANASGFELGK